VKLGLREEPLSESDHGPVNEVPRAVWPRV
jgi:hypothetical protein